MNREIIDISSKDEKTRFSNIELLRIITMFFIVAHHYVVNSNLYLPNSPVLSNLLDNKSIMLLLFGAWGKIGINIFVLITGYFMCTSKISLRKYIKLFLEVIFYNVTIYVIFSITGESIFSIKGMLSTLFPVKGIGQDFVSCYLVFYLMIPFLNILIEALDREKHKYLIGLLLLFYSVLATLQMPINLNYVTWFIIVYIIAAYLRLYPSLKSSNLKYCGLLCVGAILGSSFSVIGMAYIKASMGIGGPYALVTDCNSIFAVITAIACFQFFKILPIHYSPVINKIAGTTFGVLLIHANSGTMSNWLWNELLDARGGITRTLLFTQSVACW